jgi:uncharacterized protein (DUF4415 family)
MSVSKKQRLKKIEAIRDVDIDYTDIPELSKAFWENATLQYPEKKKSITLRVDTDIINWFKSKGKGYQTKINAILRSYYEAHKRKVS